MGTDRYGRRTFRRESLIVIAVISLAGQIAFGGLAGPAGPQPDPGMARLSNSLPSQIITTDGAIYIDLKISRREPDGLLVEFRPATGGVGLAKLKFAMLPESLQKQFGYDPGKASTFEHEQKLATFALAQKLRHDETRSMAVSEDMSDRPNLTGAVTVNSFDPTVTYTYYAPGQKPDVLTGGIAICEHDYQCRAEFDVHSEPGHTGGPIHFYIDKVRISLGLNCHITEPQFPFDKVRLHEEGRRKIYEYFYQFGSQMAQRVGESMIGKQFNPPGMDFETAKAGALSVAQAMIQGQYRARLDSIASQANQYYEKLTDYDENDFNTDQAVQQAIAKYAGQINVESQAPFRPPPLPANQVMLPPTFPRAFPISPN